MLIVSDLIDNGIKITVNGNEKSKRIDMPDLIQNSIKKKHSVNAFYMYEDWIDYGSKETFLKLKRKNKKRRI